MNHRCCQSFAVAAAALLACLCSSPAAAQVLVHTEPLVPGHGVRLSKVGDDFEENGWSYARNDPKSSSNIDKNMRAPIGISANERIFESTYRGHPDVVKRIATPEGGIAGSGGALLMQSRATGVPGRPSGKQQQDDLMVNVFGVLDREIGPHYQPSCTVRVYVPAWEKWEDRDGSSFGFRLDCEAWDTKRGAGMLAGRYTQSWQNYWPGMFIVLNRAEDGHDQTHAQLLVRAGPSGEDIAGPLIVEPGWYTLGMSLTPNGEVHYFAKKGVGDLTAKDHIASEFPYGFRCEKFNLLFFNIVNIDDGRSVSTPWVIDDPMVYFIPRNWSDEQIARYNTKLKANRQARAEAQLAQATPSTEPAAPVVAVVAVDRGASTVAEEIAGESPAVVSVRVVKGSGRPLHDKAFILRR